MIRPFVPLLFIFVAGSVLHADDVLEQILAKKYVEPITKRIVGFTDYEGDWAVNADGVVSVGVWSGPKLVCDVPELSDLTEGEVSVEMFFPGQDNNGSAGGILTKVQRPGNGADAFVGYAISIFPDAGYLHIGRHRFNYEQVARVPHRFPNDRWITLRVVFAARFMELFIDEQFVHRYEDEEAPLISGGIALRPWQRNVQYRNLRVKPKPDAEWISLPFAAPVAVEKDHPASLAVDTLPPILCLVRSQLTAPAAVATDLWQSQPMEPGCAIRLIHPANPKEKTITIFEDPRGCIYDMNLSLDAKTIFFSYRPEGERYWHLWSINVDGTGLRQLTDGPFYDVSPCQLPNGDLIFVSTRRFGYTVCQPGPASNLHRLSGLGVGETPIITCVSMNTLSDMSPQMLPDGRVLFTRWEYIDRDLGSRQGLWTQNPDGSAYQLFFGNTILSDQSTGEQRRFSAYQDVPTFWQARPLPGTSNQVIATFAPHHNYPHGMIGLIDRRQGVEGVKGKSYIYITNEVPVIEDRNMPWMYRDPFPLSDTLFLCSFGDGPYFFDNGKKRFGLYLLNREGQRRLIYEDPVFSCFFPIPLRPSEPIRVIGDRVTPPIPERLANLTDGSLIGTVVLTNVNEGLQGRVEPGTIKSLRIMEQVRKTEDIRRRAYDQSPVMGYGTYYAKRDWGTVILEDDGSAHFTVPALREIYFQALDSEGREVHRMTSALQVMPGESLSCIGCHESRDAAPPPTARLPIAARKPPQKPKIADWFLQRERINSEPDPQIFDYPSVVQPVLDRYCVECHNGTKAEGGYDLTGDKTRYFSMSYDNLLGRSRSYRQHDMQTGEMLPEEAAKGKPLVHFFWLLQTPTAVNRPYLTGSHASRLTELIESNHAGEPIPLEERQKIYYWIDANVPYYGTYAHARPETNGLRDRFADPKTGENRSWFANDFTEVWQRRCAECHNQYDHDAHWTGKFAWINLTRPENSPALRAHQSDDEGGRGIPIPGKTPSFFSAKDSDYQKMLRAIEEGRDDMLQHPEADMPNFRQARAEP